MAKRTWIVVPAFNEERRLDVRGFVAFLAAHPQVHILFVDDGSTDGTLRAIDAVCHAVSNSSVVALPANQGKAEAVRAGMQAARASGAQLVGYWDADLATPLDEIPRFVAELDDPRVDLVLGCRVRLLGRNIERQNARHYFGRIAATAASVVLGLPIYDTQCGAKLFRTGPVFDAVFAQPFASRWAFDVEVVGRWCTAYPELRGNAFGEKAKELPVSTWRDVAGSKLRARDFVATPWALWKTSRALRAYRASASA